MTMNEYTFTWEDTVMCSAIVMAESKEQALSKFHKGEREDQTVDHVGSIRDFCIDGEELEEE